jgi:peptidyl-tRNA hydrolase, PTH1 family
LKSIIACLRTEEFIRLRIGIQPEHPVGDTKNFVLENFSRSDTEKLNDILERSAAAIISVIRDGIEKAMARWNADLGLRIAD